MNNSKFKEEKVIIKLYKGFEWTIPYKFLTFIWLVTEFCILLDKSRFYSENDYYYYIWEIPFYDLDKYGGGLSIINLLTGISITIIIASIPFLFRSIYNFFVMKNKIILTERQIYGIQTSYFSKRKFYIPINKIDKICISKEFADKFRSGRTIIINYDSCIYKFHYVHNADEFTEAVMKQIKK